MSKSSFARPAPALVSGGETDAVLMRQFAAGNLESFEELYRRHEGKVWRFIYRSVGNQASADDLMQEVWFAVVTHAARYTPDAKFTTWLFTVARNRVIDALRISRPQTALDEELLLDDASPGPLEIVVGAETRRVLFAAIESLPLEQSEAFLLQAEGELTVAEIAIATEVTFETAKSRLRYARSTLRRKLQEHQ
jgi:RNA polymerase sigma-70 factor (ECF subfamily)